MTRILVTGGAGYVGSVAVGLLVQRGYEVTVLDALLFRNAGALLGVWGDSACKLIVADLRDHEAVARAVDEQDAVIHLAAIVGDPACSRAPRLAQEINYAATLALLERAETAGVKRFVFASTCSNYGRVAGDRPIAEDGALNPISLYAKTKVAAETAVVAACRPKFGTVVFRLATAFGASPRMRFDLTVNQFLMEAYHDRRLKVYGEQFWRPYAHVRDIAAALELGVRAEHDLVAGEVFNLGADENNHQKSEIALLACSLVPETEITYVKVDEDPRDYRVSFEKARRVLGFRAHLSVREGMSEILQLLRWGAFPEPKAPRYTNLQSMGESAGLAPAPA